MYLIYGPVTRFSKAATTPITSVTLLPSPNLLVLATSERFLSARGTFRAILASESHWLQPMLVLSVRWWPTPASVGRVDVREESAVTYR